MEILFFILLLFLPGALIGAAITLWVTFVPCFAFVFIGAPWIEKMQGSRLLAGGLAAITAAVVGVIANLALWFALQVIFTAQETVRIGPLSIDLPVPASIDFAAGALALLAAIALFRLRLGVFGTLALVSACGVGLSFI